MHAGELWESLASVTPNHEQVATERLVSSVERGESLEEERDPGRRRVLEDGRVEDEHWERRFLHRSRDEPAIIRRSEVTTVPEEVHTGETGESPLTVGPATAWEGAATYKSQRGVTTAMLEEALRYPTSGDDALERLLIGGVLMIFSVFVIPVFLVYGYLVRTLAAVAAGDEEPPSFEDWEELLVDGLKAFAIALVYGIVPVLLVLAVFVPVTAGLAVGGDGSRGVFAGAGILAALFLIAIALVVAYVVMAALATFAVEGRVGAAFDFRAVGEFATSGPYLVAIVLAIVIQIALGVAITAAVILTFGLALLVLIPLGAFINFWVYLVGVHLFGAAYREAMGEEAA